MRYKYKRNRKLFVYVITYGPKSARFAYEIQLPPKGCRPPPKVSIKLSPQKM